MNFLLTLLELESYNYCNRCDHKRSLSLTAKAESATATGMASTIGPLTLEESRPTKLVPQFMVKL